MSGAAEVPTEERVDTDALVAEIANEIVAELNADPVHPPMAPHIISWRKHVARWYWRRCQAAKRRSDRNDRRRRALMRKYLMAVNALMVARGWR